MNTVIRTRDKNSFTLNIRQSYSQADTLKEITTSNKYKHLLFVRYIILYEFIYDEFVV